jgi:hypothetical protein
MKTKEGRMKNTVYTVILAMAFGLGKGSGMGCSNEQIAEAVLEEIEEYGTPAFIERDVASAMCGDEGGWLSGKGKIKIFGENDPGYLPGLKIIEAFKLWQEENYPNMSNILLITAPPYEARCKRDLEKFFPDIQVDTPLFLDAKHGRWFEKSSSQWWTRSNWAWAFRECLISLLPRTMYEWLSTRR